MSETVAYDRNQQINDKNLTGFFVIFALFSASLAMMPVVSSKIVVVGGYALPSSVFLWALTYPASDIIAEVYGRRYAHKMVLGGFIAYAFMFYVIWASIQMTPAPFWDGQKAYAEILGSTWRVAIACLVSYTVTQFLDVTIFSFIRKRTQGRFLWLRNNISTIISQTLANTIFLSIAFLGVFPMDKWLDLYTNNLVARYILVLSDTVIVYLAVYVLYKLYPELKKAAYN